MNNIKNHPYPATLVACSLGLALFLSLTNPNNVAIGLLVVPVVFFFLMAFSVAQMTLNGLHLIRKDPRKRRIVALLSAALLTVIVILQSTGGISMADVVLLVMIVVISSVYVDKF